MPFRVDPLEQSTWSALRRTHFRSRRHQDVRVLVVGRIALRVGNQRGGSVFVRHL